MINMISYVINVHQRGKRSQRKSSGMGPESWLH